MSLNLNLIATFALLVSFSTSCSKTAEVAPKNYDDAFFQLGKQIKPLEPEKLVCAISIQSTDIIGDLGEGDYDKLYFYLTRDVAIPFSGAQIRGNSAQLYIPSYQDCSEALTVTQRLVTEAKPKDFPIIKIVDADDFKKAMNF